MTIERAIESINYWIKGTSCKTSFGRLATIKIDDLQVVLDTIHAYQEKESKEIHEIDTLQKENESLRETLKNADERKLRDLLSQVMFTGYRVDMKHIQRPKCDKCDEYRQIHFVSPTGRNMTEDCLCATAVVRHSPKEVSLVSFNVSDKVSSFYAKVYNSKDSYYDKYNICTDLYDKDKEQSFESLNKYKIVFLNKDDCQAYCDWLNEYDA